MQNAPPAEPQRRPIGHFGQGLDQLRAGEEAQRPHRGAARPRLGLLAAHTRLSKRRGRNRLGLFRQMRVDKLASCHRAGPEPGGEPIEKLSQRTGALGLVRALSSASEGASGSAVRQARRMRSTP